MGALYFAVEPGRSGLDVAVADPFVEHVVVEGGLEFGAVICLDHLHGERQPLKHLVDELDRGFLVAAWVDA